MDGLLNAIKLIEKQVRILKTVNIQLSAAANSKCKTNDEENVKIII